MSRVAGLFSPQAENESELLAMLSSMSGQSFAPALHSCERFSYGYSSDLESASLQTEHLVLLIQGPLYTLNAEPCSLRNLAEYYLEQGFVKLLQAINGDCALALYDRQQQRLWLGRDRLGVKPLYYTQHDGRFAFASQPGALALGRRLEANPHYVGRFAGAHYRYFDNAPETSPFRAVSQLPAAQWLCVDRSGEIQKGHYWQLQDLPDWESDAASLAEQYQSLLMDAVAIRQRASQAPAFTLSGGMDSSSVLSCAVQLSGEKQIALSSVYEDATYDERDEIRTILDQTVQHWHPVEIGTPDVWALIQQMVRVHHEPVATATWLSHYLVCQQALELGQRSLFGGLGGDELNAGEYEYFFYYFADLLGQGRERDFLNEVQYWKRYHDHPLYPKNESTARETLSRVVNLQQPGECRVERHRLERYAESLNPEFLNLKTFQPRQPNPFRSYLKNRSWQDLFYETTPCCLRAQDRHGAYWGVPHYTPFLDYRLLEFMFRVPGDLKIQQGVTKILLREAMAGVVPDSTRQRIKKTGWNAPAHVWFSGENTQFLLDLVQSQRFRQRGIYNPQAVEALILEHEAIVREGRQQENHMMFLWQLMNLEAWFQWLES